MPLVLACLQNLVAPEPLSLDLCSRAISSCLQAALEAASCGAAEHQHLNSSIALPKLQHTINAQRINLSHYFQVRVQVSLNKVVDHVFDIMGHLVKKKVTLEKNLAPDLPHIIADGSRVVQASCPALATMTVLFMANIWHVMPDACCLCKLPAD